MADGSSDLGRFTALSSSRSTPRVQASSSQMEVDSEPGAASDFVRGVASTGSGFSPPRDAGIYEPYHRRSIFWVGEGPWIDVKGETHACASYVECLEPVMKTKSIPVVLVHGDYHTGSVWLHKPDFQPGWAHYFLSQGYTVYLIDIPPNGRSNKLDTLLSTFHIYCTTMSKEFMEQELTAPGKRPEQYVGWPSAKLHNQWPGTGLRGDPYFENYASSTTSVMLTKDERQVLGQEALVSLLQRIGKSVLIGQGTGGTIAWLAADIVPYLVSGIVVIEPSGPPFGITFKPSSHGRIYTSHVQRRRDRRDYGIADIPVTYDPPARLLGFPFEIGPEKNLLAMELEQAGNSDKSKVCFLQRSLNDALEPAMPRPVVGLEDSIPIPDNETPQEEQAIQEAAVQQPTKKRFRTLCNIKSITNQLFITSECSSHSTYDFATVQFLRQAGVSIEWCRLEQHGIHGNGHLCFLEMNSDHIAKLVDSWIKRHVLIPSEDEGDEPDVPGSPTRDSVDTAARSSPICSSPNPTSKSAIKGKGVAERMTRERSVSFRLPLETGQTWPWLSTESDQQARPSAEQSRDSIDLDNERPAKRVCT